MGYQVRLPIFEGPFELLFHLIEQEEVTIWDIPIARITEQYLEYIASIQELDLDLAGDFLVMASTLLAIKARMLLPQPSASASVEEQVDPRIELVSRLLEYRKFKEAARIIAQLARGRDKLYPRGFSAPAETATPHFIRPVGDATVADLVQAMHSVLAAYEPPSVSVAMPRRILTVEERLTELEAFLAAHPFCTFRTLLPPRPTREDVVVTFLALLELIRRGMLVTKQEQPFGAIGVMADQVERHG